MTTPIAPVIAPIAARKKKAMLTAESLLVGAQRRALDRLSQQHLLGEDQIRAGVVRELVVMAHRDRVKGTGQLAVAAEDAAAEVDLVHGRVALPGRDPVLRRVLGRHHADAVGRAGSRAQRAADALLQARVLKAVELVPAPEARVDGGLLLRVLDRRGSLHDPGESRLETAQRLAKGSVRAGRHPRRGLADDLDYVG